MPQQQKPNANSSTLRPSAPASWREAGRPDLERTGLLGERAEAQVPDHRTSGRSRSSRTTTPPARSCGSPDARSSSREPSRAARASCRSIRCARTVHNAANAPTSRHSSHSRHNRTHSALPKRQYQWRSCVPLVWGVPATIALHAANLDLRSRSGSAQQDLLPFPYRPGTCG